MEYYFGIIVILFIFLFIFNCDGYISLYHFNGDINSALSLLNSISQVLGSILAIEFSLIILTLEMISQRRSLTIFNLFFKKKINNFGPFIYLAGNIITSLYTMSFLKTNGQIPYEILDLNFFYSVSSLLIMFVYFIHIITFIKPESLVKMIVEESMKALKH